MWNYNVGYKEYIYWRERCLEHLPMPHVTIFLDANPQCCYDRIQSRARVRTCTIISTSHFIGRTIDVLGLWEWGDSGLPGETARAISPVYRANEVSRRSLNYRYSKLHYALNHVIPALLWYRSEGTYVLRYDWSTFREEKIVSRLQPICFLVIIFHDVFNSAGMWCHHWHWYSQMEEQAHPYGR